VFIVEGKCDKVLHSAKILMDVLDTYYLTADHRISSK
jgi:hypothetical protein